jgi:SAM-dependent methyltransferase
MMFGLREPFTYFECTACGCLQLIDRPPNLAPYYPPAYYSFAPTQARTKPTGWRAWAERRRTRAQLLGHRGLWGSIARFRPRVDLDIFRPARLPSLKARILDVGCGGGTLLRKLEEAGCRDLVGVDPFLPGDQALGPHLRLLARPFAELPDDSFDLIMFHHSLEHMPDTLAALDAAARRLRPGGVCLVRIPVASCEAWSLYGTDWVELDAPRHFFLHTPRSLAHAAERCGLRIFHTAFEAITLPYWGSELYRRGIPLFDAERGALHSPRSVFSSEVLADFERRARRAVRQGQGGPAAFYLRRAA